MSSPYKQKIILPLQTRKYEINYMYRFSKFKRLKYFPVQSKYLLSEFIVMPSIHKNPDFD